jgi:nitrous oxidase accessory protein
MRAWVYYIVFIQFFPSLLWARTVTVGRDEKITSIARALLLVSAGDTIVVRPGIYREGNIRIDKPVVLIGKNRPVLDGENKYELITVTSPHVTIRGFRLINSGISGFQDVAGIGALQADYLSVADNEFYNTFFGVKIMNSNYCSVTDNYFQAAEAREFEIGNGIHLWQCSEAVIRNNRVTQHRDGIYFEFVTRSVIERNICSENLRYGLHFMFSHEDEYRDNVFRKNGAGVAVMYTRNVKMIRNVFEENEGNSVYGMLLKDISDSEVSLNTFRKNTIAVYMEGTSRTRIYRNNYINNGYAIRLQVSCDNNDIVENNFLNNTFDLATNGSLVLNNLSRNYWDKYQGYDLNKDGTGDIPYSPVSLYSMIVERIPAAVFLWRSFLVYLLDRAEKALPVVTPENLKDASPRIKPHDFNTSA